MYTIVVISPRKEIFNQVSSIVSPHKEFNLGPWGQDSFDALRLVNIIKPHIVILDHRLEIIEWDKLPPFIKIRSPTTSVCILTRGMTEIQLIQAAINKVLGFVQRDTDMDYLPMALKNLIRGEYYLSPPLTTRLITYISKHYAGMGKPNPRAVKKKEAPAFNTKKDPILYLSKREIAILIAVGSGQSSKEIAADHCITVGTLRNLITVILRKTGQKNRLGLARFAIESHLASSHGE